MLSTPSACPTVVCAILTKEVKYTKLGHEIVLECGKNIELDIDTEICLVGKCDYVQLNVSDYKVMMN